jgi:hypothetical protein
MTAHHAEPSPSPSVESSMTILILKMERGIKGVRFWRAINLTLQNPSWRLGGLPFVENL